MFKKLATFVIAASVFCTNTSSLEAQACYTGGCGYQECRTCPSMTPAIALGAIALVAIIAVAVQKHEPETRPLPHLTVLGILEAIAKLPAFFSKPAIRFMQLPLQSTGLLISCFLLSCCPLFSEWNLNSIMTSSKEYNSMRLHYKNPSPFEWTFSELILSPSGIRFILNLTFCPIEPGDVTIQSNDKDLHGYLLEGGEKILLTQGDTEWILQRLLEDEKVDLAVDRYKTSLSPEGFKEVWSQAKHLLLTKKIDVPIK